MDTEGTFAGWLASGDLRCKPNTVEVHDIDGDVTFKAPLPIRDERELRQIEIAMLHGQTVGESIGRSNAQRAMRKAAGID